MALPNFDLKSILVNASLTLTFNVTLTHAFFFSGILRSIRQMFLRTSSGSNEDSLQEKEGP